MSTEEEKKQKKLNEIKEELNALHKLRHQTGELESYLQEECRSEFKEIQSLDEQIEELRKKQDVVRAQIVEKEERVSKELVKAREMISHKEAKIKALCHSLPNDVIDTGIKIEGEKYEARISKVSIVTSYRSEALLAEHPELEEMYVDNDPVVGRTINAPVLDRLIASGEVQEEDMSPYRIESRKRAPSVRIKER